MSGRLVTAAIWSISSDEVFVQDAPWFRDGVDLSEHLLLHGEIFEHRFDDDIGLIETVKVAE